MKTCTNKKCERFGVLLSLDQFGKDKRNKDGLNNWCKVCINAYNSSPHIVAKRKSRFYDKKYASKPENKLKAKEYWHRPENKERRKGYQYKYTYGISMQDFKSLVLHQDGKCAICNCAERLCIDHDHETNNVRELLCNSCNAILGMCKEDIDVLKRAISYLEKHKEIKNL